MPSNFTVRFYDVEKTGDAVPDLRDALQGILKNYNTLEKRTRQLASGFQLRLERFSVDGDYILGEFTRVMEADYPYEVLPTGAAPLNTNGPIGNGIAFRFRASDHTLIVQYDPRVASPSRLFEYILQLNNQASYQIEPKMDAENWRKFNEYPLRTLRIGVASPSSVPDVENDGASVAEAFRSLSDAYGGPSITFEIGMGHKKGSLNESAKQAMRVFYNHFSDNTIDVRTLRAKVKTEDDAPAEDINLIDEIVSNKYKISLPVNDPDTNYEVRRDFLRDRLNEH